MAFCQECQSDFDTEYTDVLRKCKKHATGACSGCGQLLELERKIADARQLLQNLLDERKRMSSFLNDCHDPLATVVPIEIASQIFRSVPTFKPYNVGLGRREGYNMIHHNCAVLLPGQVCSLWRNIARSTPELWTVLCARPMHPLSNLMVEKWIGHSLTLPLFLQLDMYQYFGDDLTETAQAVLQLVIPHLSRCQVLQISAGRTWSAISSAISSVAMSKVEHVLLEGHSRIHHDCDWNLIRLNAAPLLLTQRSILLRQISMDLSRLTHVVADMAYIQDCVLLFQNAPQLLSCDIQELMDTDEASLPDPIQSHNTIRTLCIGSCRDPKFFRPFSFPSLEDLQFVSRHCDWHGMAECLRSPESRLKELMLTGRIGEYDQQGFADALRATPSLERLCISTEDEDEPNLTEALRCIPQLKHLAIMLNSEQPHRLFSFAIGPEESTPELEGFLPQLSSVYYRTVTSPAREDCIHDCNLSPLLAFLESRHQSDSLHFELEIAHTGTDEGGIELCWDKETFERVLVLVRDLGIKFKLTESDGLDEEDCDLKDRLLRLYDLSIDT